MAQASLEELMNLEISSVARKEEKLSRAAAAVFVITQDDIRRSGATSLPEVLRLAPGLAVARLDPSKWAVSARGFNGRVANKMLVLIDGRSVYTQLYSGTYWEQYDILLEDIERIEIIRGPGSTTWGANAMNGVINIITKTAAASEGGLVTMSGGPADGYLFGARYGGRLGKRLRYRVSTRLADSGTMVRDFRTGEDGPTRTARGGGRLEWEINARESLTVHGDLYQGGGRQDISDSISSVGRVRPRQENIDFAGGYLQARWRRTGERSDTALQWFLNVEDRDESLGRSQVRTSDLDFQNRNALGRRHDLIWGLGYRAIYDQLRAGDRASVSPATQLTGLSSSFIQDDWSLVRDKLVLSAGTKYLYQQHSGGAWQPGARLAFTPNNRETFWTSATRAVRTPSRRDLDIKFVFALPPSLAPDGVFAEYQGNRGFQNERVISVEAGYRRQFGEKWSVDLALFRSGYDRLQAFAFGSPDIRLQPEFRVVVPLALNNGGSAVSKGGEVVVQWKPSTRFRASLNYSHLSVAQAVADALGDTGNRDPRHMLQSHLSWDLSRKVSFDAFAYGVSGTAAGRVPGYARADARLAWRVNGHAELSAGGRNLLQPRHREMISEDFTIAQQVRRSAYVRFTWRF